MSFWRTILSAFCAAPTLPMHRITHEVNRGRREASAYTARVHDAAQASAIDKINEYALAIDTLDAWVKGRDADG